MIGHDYQHVYPLGGDRYLWLFQDTFIDHTGNAARLDQAAFAHNTAMLQHGSCFTLLHRGTAAAPPSFEPGTGEQLLDPVVLAARRGDGRRPRCTCSGPRWPRPPTRAARRARLGAGADVAGDVRRLDAGPARRSARRPTSGVDPIYGFAVASDDEHTYLFGNTFDQNLARQGGYCGLPVLGDADVPRPRAAGQLDVAPGVPHAVGLEHATPTAAVPIVDRFHAENPMQPRFLGGQLGRGDEGRRLLGRRARVDVAAHPWGPWTTVSRRPLSPRGGDPLMNTYHAHLMPWLSGGGLVVSVSQNARDMLARRLAAARPVPPAVPRRSLAAAARRPPTTTTPTRHDDATVETTTSTTPDDDRRRPRPRRRPTTDGRARHHARAQHDADVVDGPGRVRDRTTSRHRRRRARRRPRP